VRRCVLDMCGSGQGQVVDYGLKNLSGTIKGREFLD
jgi:hypothetical protein